MGTMVAINSLILHPDPNINIPTIYNNLDLGIWFETIISWKHPYDIKMQADNWKIRPPDLFSHQTIWNTLGTMKCPLAVKLEGTQSPKPSLTKRTLCTDLISVTPSLWLLGEYQSWNLMSRLLAGLVVLGGGICQISTFVHCKSK